MIDNSEVYNDLKVEDDLERVLKQVISNRSGNNNDVIIQCNGKSIKLDNSFKIIYEKKKSAIDDDIPHTTTNDSGISDHASRSAFRNLTME